jgi:hypothetical protein
MSGSPLVSIRAEVACDPQICHDQMIVAPEDAKLGPVTAGGVPIHFRGLVRGAFLSGPSTRIVSDPRGNETS